MIKKTHWRKSMKKTEKKGQGQLYRDVLQGLENMIADGIYNPGDKLPSEREMAELFCVSRVPVREAIKILEYMGILEIIPGDGVYITNKKDFSDISKSFSSDISDITEDLMINLFELRCILESSACYYAAQRRTEKDIIHLKKIIEAAQQEKENISLSTETENEEIFEKLKEISHMFHTSIVEAAHNAVLTSLYKSLYDALEISKTLTISQADYTFNGILAHEFLLQRIINREAEEARLTMLQHLEDARQKMLKTLHQGDPSSVK